MTMTEKVEQRICIKFCQKLGDTCAETYAKLQKVYGEECMSRTRVYDWFKRFQDGRQNVNSDARSGRPTTSRTNKNIADVCAAVLKGHRITVRELSKDVNISYGSVQAILAEDLGLRCESAEFVEKFCKKKKNSKKKKIKKNISTLKI